MKKPVVCRLSSIVILLLFTFHFTLSTSYAASPPNPQPCKNPIVDQEKLVDNYLLNKDGKPLSGLTLSGYAPVTGNDGDQIPLPARTFSFTVDFSKLQSLFGTTNSNYLEGRTQDEVHRGADITSLTSPDFVNYNGPNQKTSPKVVIDSQKQKYVEYVYNKPTLPEAANQYSDIEGNGPQKTIYDMVQEYGLPNPPDASATEPEKNIWLNTWGKYWPKIPTAYSEFYQGELAFHWVAGDYALGFFKSNPICPLRIEPPIKFVMPEFFRTTSTSDQLNRQIVPCAAQSIQHTLDPKNCERSGRVQAAKDSASPKDFLTNVLRFCWQLISHPPQQILEKFRQLSPISSNPHNLFTLLNPINLLVPPAFAAEPTENPSCLKILKDAKSGQAPYCPLPQEEIARLGSSVSCGPKTDNLNLDKTNPNVNCTFTVTLTGARYLIDALDPACTPQGGTVYQCQPKVYILPNFRIPWLAAIWNNTTYSSEAENLQSQETGRPGIYTFFTPQAVYDELFPSTYDQALDLLQRCWPNWPDTSVGDQTACDQLDKIGGIIPCRIDVSLEELAACVSGKLTKSLPGRVNAPGENLKERFIGSVDCSKGFVRDIFLKPKVLQDFLGIKNVCETIPSIDSPVPPTPAMTCSVTPTNQLTVKQGSTVDFNLNVQNLEAGDLYVGVTYVDGTVRFFAQGNNPMYLSDTARIRLLNSNNGLLNSAGGGNYTFNLRVISDSNDIPQLHKYQLGDIYIQTVVGGQQVGQNKPCVGSNGLRGLDISITPISAMTCSLTPTNQLIVQQGSTVDFSLNVTNLDSGQLYVGVTYVDGTVRFFAQGNNPMYLSDTARIQLLNSDNGVINSVGGSNYTWNLRVISDSNDIPQQSKYQLSAIYIQTVVGGQQVGTNLQCLGANGLGGLDISVVAAPQTPPSAPTGLVVNTSCNTSSGVSAIVTFRWNSASGATSYDINFDKSGTPQNTPLQNIGGTSVTYSDFSMALLVNWWQVRSVNSVGVSSWTNAPSFTTAACAVGQPTVTNNCSTATIAWTGSIGAVGPGGAFGFWVDVSTSSSFTSFSNKFVSSSPTDTSGMNPNLTLNSGTTYFVRIYNGVHSPTTQFTFTPTGCSSQMACSLTPTNQLTVQLGSTVDFSLNVTNLATGDLYVGVTYVDGTVRFFAQGNNPMILSSFARIQLLNESGVISSPGGGSHIFNLRVITDPGGPTGHYQLSAIYIQTVVGGQQVGSNLQCLGSNGLGGLDINVI